ncbi:unnamed protein product [Sphenostylis stenocarpa]|uniref:Stem 28 kDa glycoprotein n=1 Tax=Sphenostylis stenocarpa TaxID=92480 RepID=A0AA86VJQ0_9FABA|nr:unnamed protein product [Sphenostylis stenocarpa]
MSMKVFVLFVATILVASQCHGASFRSFPLKMETGYGDESYAPVGDLLQKHTTSWAGKPFLKSAAVKVYEKEVIVFSIDGTVLSNVLYYSQHGYGVEKFNSTRYDEFVNKGDLPALPETLRNYRYLVNLGYKIIFLSGRHESKRAVTEANLKAAGYHTWEKLILKKRFVVAGTHQTILQMLEFKKAEKAKLVQQGYRIVAVIGDQWSDLQGQPKGIRIFKLPNPMYYIH